MLLETIADAKAAVSWGEGKKNGKNSPWVCFWMGPNWVCPWVLVHSYNLLELNFKTVLRPASAWDRFWRDFLEVWGVPKQTSLNFSSDGFRMEISTFWATSKKFRPPSGNFRPNSPELPRSSSRSGSSEEAGRKIVLSLTLINTSWAKTVHGGNDRIVLCKRDP